MCTQSFKFLNEYTFVVNNLTPLKAALISPSSLALRIVRQSIFTTMYQYIPYLGLHTCIQNKNFIICSILFRIHIRNNIIIINIINKIMVATFLVHSSTPTSFPLRFLFTSTIVRITSCLFTQLIISIIYLIYGTYYIVNLYMHISNFFIYVLCYVSLSSSLFRIYIHLFQLCSATITIAYQAFTILS